MINFSYNYQTLNFKNNISCVGNVDLFYFDKYGKLQLLNIQTQLPVGNEFRSVIFI